MIGTGAMCDPYMHIEVDLNHTRRCLEIIDRYGFGLSIQTKSNRILRDLDLLKSINQKSKCVVQTTLTTLDEGLCRIIEPEVSTTMERSQMLMIMQEQGLPTVVWLGPLLPFINDTEENLRGILHYCIEAGVYGIICFGIGLTLREGNREYYYAKLDAHFPGLKYKYIQKYGLSYEARSDNNGALMDIFHSECETHGIVHNNDDVFKYLHTFEEKQQTEQLSLL